MGIVSVTRIAGSAHSGKTFVSLLYNSKPTHFIIDNILKQTKAELWKKLDDWKASPTDRHIVLVDDIIYQTIDYDFGNVTQYYVSLDVKKPTVYKEEAPSKPILGD